MSVGGRLGARRQVRILLWGTYDLTKPRVRLMRRALQSSGNVHEIHADIWTGVEDKSQLRGWKIAWIALRWLLAYPRLIARLLFAPRPDVLVVGYLGHFDVLILAPFARLRRIPIVWDAFLSLYDTIVRDRRLIGPDHPLARLIFVAERRACRAADAVVLDTHAHAALFRELYGVAETKLHRVFVGAEQEAFAPSARPAPLSHPSGPVEVLFYGQFIPLHGIETIVDAARLARDEDIRWHLIGKGQQAALIRSKLEADPIPSLLWEAWVPYERLVERIACCDVTLGIFGTSDKASRVIPNKVFQMLMSDKPLITRDSPAIRELPQDANAAIVLIPAGNPQALVEAILSIAQSSPNIDRKRIRAAFAPVSLATQWMAIMTQVAGRKVTQN